MFDYHIITNIFYLALFPADGSATFTTTPKPAQIMYGAKLKFVELGDNYILPTRGSREYNKLQERISKALETTELSLVPGFEEVVINKFRGYVALRDSELRKNIPAKF